MSSRSISFSTMEFSHLRRSFVVCSRFGPGRAISTAAHSASSFNMGISPATARFSERCALSSREPGSLTRPPKACARAVIGRSSRPHPRSRCRAMNAPPRSVWPNSWKARARIAWYPTCRSAFSSPAVSTRRWSQQSSQIGSEPTPGHILSASRSLPMTSRNGPRRSRRISVRTIRPNA